MYRSTIEKCSSSATKLSKFEQHLGTLMVTFREIFFEFLWKKGLTKIVVRDSVFMHYFVGNAKKKNACYEIVSLYVCMSTCLCLCVSVGPSVSIIKLLNTEASKWQFQGP